MPNNTKEATINIALSNNQALHLWSITVSHIEGTTKELKAARVLKNDGTRNLTRKYISDYHQERLDTLALAYLILKDIENNADFSEIEEAENGS